MRVREVGETEELMIIRKVEETRKNQSKKKSKKQKNE